MVYYYRQRLHYRGSRQTFDPKFRASLKNEQLRSHNRLLEYFREVGGRNAHFNLAPTHQF